MRIFLAILLSAWLSSAALASGGGGGGGNATGSGNRIVTLFNLSGDEDAEDSVEDEEMAANPRVFTLPAVVAPLSADGRLTGYAYVRVRVRAADGHNVWDMQERTHFALDAMVRAASRIPLSTTDGSALDRDLATRVWDAVLRDYYGASAIAEIRVGTPDTLMLRR